MATDSTRKFANLAFFKSFGEGELGEIMLYSELKNFDNGQIIFKEGDAAVELYVIVTGKVEILKSISGQSVSIATLEENDIFGENAILTFSTGKRMASTKCVTDTSCLVVTRKQMDDLFSANPAIAAKFFKVVGIICHSRLARIDDMYTQLFVTTRGSKNLSELKDCYQKLMTEWRI